MAEKHPADYKSILRPMLVWTYIAVVAVSLALGTVVVVTERATFNDVSGVLMIMLGTLGAAVTTYVFSRGKEKIAGKDRTYAVESDSGGDGADGS